MNEREFNEKRKIETLAFVIEIGENYFLTEGGTISDLSHARIVKAPVTADELAKEYNGEKRLIDLSFKLLNAK